jgi:cytochrome bd-type quinol oxidase subunit 2
MSTTTSAPQGNTGPLGKPRGVLFVLLLTLVTIGIYSIYWAYKTHEEIKQHTGEGVGGVLGLVIWILVSPVSAFVIPSEIGKMYAREGRASPVTGWTGLWYFPFGILIIPLIVWFVKVQGALNRYWESKAAAAPPPPPPAAA